jgi:tRNA threonylcarbamoyladenosine biosynthesis protein TsaE
MEATSSPTFSLVNEYQTNDNQIVYHFDFYRLKRNRSVRYGIDEYLYSETGALSSGPKTYPT